MEQLKMLSGDQLVAKGVTKLDASLPEVGMKDVLPNGSWLEQKQIQSALEARKHLVEVERIEKRGVLSHASWCDEQKLAEVTQQAGGYWQYLGHHIGKKLYLRPEEALFLMETNCLLLKYNEVVVSLQKAYSLLLGEEFGIFQYKVYASLSRIGYKVFRHRIINVKESSSAQEKDETNINKSENENQSKLGNVDSTVKVSMELDCSFNRVHSDSENDSSVCNKESETMGVGDNLIISRDTVDYDSMQLATVNTTEMSNKLDIKENNNILQENNSTNIDTNKKTTEEARTEETNNINNEQRLSENVDIRNADKSYTSKGNVEEDRNNFSKLRLQTLEKRLVKQCSNEILHKCFDFIPDLLKLTVVTVNVPNEQYIPRNVFVNKTKYDLNLNLIKSKPISNERCSSNERTYSNTDEVNAPHIRRLRNSSQTETPQHEYQSMNMRQQNFMYFRPFNFWRPQFGHNNHPLSRFFRQTFANNFFVPPPFHSGQDPFFLRPFQNFSHRNFMPRRPSTSRQYYAQNQNPNGQSRHLHSITSLAIRTKQLAASGRMQEMHIQGLRRLIDLYNATYGCQLHLTESFDLIETENIVETIELDDDDEPKKKKSRLNLHKFDENLKGIKDLALRLKIFETDYGPKPKYRRAISKVIKKFNKSYNADIYLNKDYEIINKKYVSLDSSSESDCVVTENDKKLKRKRLRNPFNIIKKRASINSTVPKEDSTVDVNQITPENNTSTRNVNSFDKNWLPGDNDFGRPEIVPKYLMNARLIDTILKKYLYEFMKNHSKPFDNWVQIKIAYLKYLEERNEVFQIQQNLINECNLSSATGTGLKPLIRPEDCSDMRTVLERLRIISTANTVTGESKYKIDFDVYSRDVKKFRKSNPPKPHFRIVCVNESDSFPAASDIGILNLKYNDNIPIMFAVVGTASISYLQINCIDLPIYVPKSDLS